MAYCFGPRSPEYLDAHHGEGLTTSPVALVTGRLDMYEERLAACEKATVPVTLVTERLDVYEERLAACEKACVDSRVAFGKLQDEQARAADRLSNQLAVPLTTVLSPDTSGGESIVESRRLSRDGEMAATHPSEALEQVKVELTETCGNLVTEQLGLKNQQFAELQHKMEQQAQFIEELRAQWQQRVQLLETELLHKVHNVESIASSQEEQKRSCFELDSRVQTLEMAVSILQKRQGPSDQNACFPNESGIPPDPDKCDDGKMESHECPAVVEHMLTNMEYDLKESTWDAGFFVFLPVYGRAVSVHQFFALLTTLMVQCAFCGVCYVNFTDSVFNQDLENSYFNFRIDIGHDYRYVNTVTSLNLIQRLCQRDAGLELVSSQLTNLQNIDGYLGAHDASFWEKLFAGPFMCILALSSWAATVSAEFRKIEEWSWAILAVPAGLCTDVVFNTADETVHLERVCVRRRIFGLAISFVRVVVTGLLLYVGLLFLAYESDVSDLLLNTVALEFILHIDELDFHAFSPQACKQFLGKVQPLVFRPFYRVGGWEFRLARETVCLVSCVTVIYVAEVIPMINSMRNIETALCRGYRAFSFSTDIFGFTYVRRGLLDDQPQNHTANPLASLMHQSILDTIMEPHDTSPDVPYKGYGFSIGPEHFAATLQEFASSGVDQLVNAFNPSCDDILNRTFPFHYRAYIQKVWSSSVTDCKDWGPRCWGESNAGSWTPTVARMVCPISCTCDDPLSPTYSGSARNGCPTGCMELQTYIRRQGALKCQDWSLQELRNSSFWDVWVNHLKLYAGPHGPTHVQAARDLEQMGCDAIRTSQSIDFWNDYCHGRLTPDVRNLRPLGMSCPQACGCNGNITYNNVGFLVGSCPSSCPALVNFVR